MSPDFGSRNCENTETKNNATLGFEMVVSKPMTNNFCGLSFIKPLCDFVLSKEGTRTA